jgi:ferredoxin
MASLAERLPINVSGRYYVDASCIDCDQCRSVSAELFGRDKDNGTSFVRRQPVNPDEVAQMNEIIAGCATNSIGDDGV